MEIENTESPEIIVEVSGTLPAESETVQPEPVQNEEVAVEEKVEKEKTFTQAQLDAIVERRLARERRKFEELQAKKKNEVPVSIDEYDSPEEYAEALAVQKAEILIEERKKESQIRQQEEVFEDLLDKAREKYSDFDSIVRNEQLPLSEIMLSAIKSSENSAELLYQLGRNPQEARRIWGLSPMQQIKEIGKFELTLANTPPVKNTSKVPSPLSPSKPRSNGSSTVDTTKASSVESLSTAEWIALEQKRMISQMK